MPAAAVIPALIAYIKVVAVKKLVVGCRGREGCWPLVECPARPFLPGDSVTLNCGADGRRPFTFKKSDRSKKAFARIC